MESRLNELNRLLVYNTQMLEQVKIKISKAQVEGAVNEDGQNRIIALNIQKQNLENMIATISGELENLTKDLSK